MSAKSRQSTIGSCRPFYVTPDSKSSATSRVVEKETKKKKRAFPDGQLTLTQMPLMTSKKAVKEAQEPDDDEISVLSLVDLTQDPETVINLVPLEDKKGGIINEGDLVQMKHGKLEQYVLMGLVQTCYQEMLTVQWLCDDSDGNGTNVYVPKIATVNPEFVSVLAQFDKPLDPAAFNWWKYKGIMRNFIFYPDGRGWSFRENSW